MKESVSVILIHEQEIYIIERQAHLKAFPGYVSFPGGKVDKEDDFYDEELFHFEMIKNVFSEDKAKLLNALKRELIEELQFDLLEHLNRDNVSSINLLGLAITPDFNPHRFKNYYFKVHLKNKPKFKNEVGEIAGAKWLNAKEAFRLYDAGEMIVVPPMISILSHLNKELTSHELIDPNLVYDPESEVPMIENVSGVKQFLPLSHTFPPANRTNCFLIGDKKKVIVDPSPVSEKEYDKLVCSLQKYSTHDELDLIFISHHHPDHHEYAPKMARQLSLPIGISEDSYNRIRKKYGDDYFDDIEIRFFKEGDILTTSKNQNVLILETPGHDEGQLSLLREDKAWCIVFDLIQTVGTVVIGGDEGDMFKYFQSLRRIIEVSPRFIFPSHGIGLGGVFKLSETLKHRLQREKSIDELAKKQLDLEQILVAIYPDLPKRLHPYARLTIKAHLDKIRNHGLG